MRPSTNPSGKRSDGSHWQSDKTHCIHGHDIRPCLNGAANPNVQRHPITGTRQCVECSRTRARLTMRVRTAIRWWVSHAEACNNCKAMQFCKPGHDIKHEVTRRWLDLQTAGFARRRQAPVLEAAA